jgi:hypothetical protein
MEGEIWKDIEGYEGIYQVSNVGRVKSLERTTKSSRNGTEYFRTIKPKILKQSFNRCGYLKVPLGRGLIRKQMYIHRLVAIAFIDNPTKKPTVDHLNTIKTDNRVCNLRWATYSEQINENAISKEKFRRNTIKTSLENMKKANESNKKKVKCITTNITFNSLKEGAEYYNIDRRRVSDCCKGKIKQHKGLRWEYID